MAPFGGLHVLSDTGPPDGQDVYTTLVFIHGYVWHGGAFGKLLPLAPHFGCRIIVLNRRDYPGASPYTAEERALLPPVPDRLRTDPDEIRSATKMLETFMEDRARELFECLQALVTWCKIAPAQAASGQGGIVLVGWSFGATFVTALLSHAAAFPVGAVNLKDYVRQVMLMDPPACLLGYFPDEDYYNPFFDSSLTYVERGHVFTNWITAYYAHGDTPDTFERRVPLNTPPSTLTSMTGDAFQTLVHVPPGVPEGSDWTLLHGCVPLGVCATLRERALYLAPPRRETQDGPLVGDEWEAVEVRLVWGDQSFWEVPYAAHAMCEEVRAAKAQGKPVRNVSVVRLEGANHFMQWHEPERTLRALLEPTGDSVI